MNSNMVSVSYQILNCLPPGMASRLRRSKSLTNSRLALLTYLFVFKSLDTVLFTLDSHGFHGVWPVLNSLLRGFLEWLAIVVSLMLVGVFVSVGNLGSNSVQLVESDHSCSILLLGTSVGWWSSDSTRVSWGWRLESSSLVSTSKRHFCFCNYWKLSRNLILLETLFNYFKTLRPNIFNN